MMKSTLLLTAALAVFAIQAPAQTVPPTATVPRVAADQITTTKGPLTVQPITHGSVVFTWNGKTIYVDPYGGAAAYAGLAAPDIILITDIHGDHLDPQTLAALSVGKALMLVPQVADKLPAAYKAQVRILRNAQRLDTLGLSVSAIPMYNLPEAADAPHPKGRGNGYVLNLGGKNVYLSGDTEDIPEMRALKGIAVAFVCMNLPYTMDVNQAAQGVLAFKPGIVYPPLPGPERPERRSRLQKNRERGQ